MVLVVAALRGFASRALKLSPLSAPFTAAALWTGLTGAVGLELVHARREAAAAVIGVSSRLWLWAGAGATRGGRRGAGAGS